MSQGPSANSAYASDLAFARRLATGDEVAWRELFAEHGPYLLGALRALLVRRGETPDPERLEELLSATVTALTADGYKVLVNYRGQCALRSWLYVIARTVVRREIQHFSREQRKDSGFWNSYKGEAAETPAADEDVARLRAARAKLSAPDQQLLALFYDQAVPQAEIARRLGTSEGNIAVRMHRLREKLRALVDAERGGDSERAGKPGLK